MMPFIFRVSLLTGIYILGAGIPFFAVRMFRGRIEGVFGEYWWAVPLGLCWGITLAGPYLYMLLKKKSRMRRIQNQYQYQNTLRNASLGMGRIKDLKRLLNLIVHIVTHAVRINHCSIYLYHESSLKYILKASKGRKIKSDALSILSADSPLVAHINKCKEPVVYRDFCRKFAGKTDTAANEIKDIMKAMRASVIIPSFIEDRLLAMVVMGEKYSGDFYTQDDLVVFSILANQSALAIENAQFFEDMKKTHEQLFRAEKMATIGMMADGLSHQINNRLHAMGFIAGDALDTIQLKTKDGTFKNAGEWMPEIVHALERIQENVRRGGETVEGLLKYTRKGAEGFCAVNLNRVFDAALEMAQFKVKLKEIKIVTYFPPDLPPVLGNFTQLQEVLFNVIDNAYDAMMQKKNMIEENDYKPKVEINAVKKGKRIELVVKDNGVGVQKEDFSKLFTPFFTTKDGVKKGTGLGMYVIRQIIEENHGGKVKFASKYGEGSQMQLFLPVKNG